MHPTAPGTDENLLITSGSTEKRLRAGTLRQASRRADSTCRADSAWANHVISSMSIASASSAPCSRSEVHRCCGSRCRHPCMHTLRHRNSTGLPPRGPRPVIPALVGGKAAPAHSGASGAASRVGQHGVQAVH